jgi:hypothetical protein
MLRAAGAQDFAAPVPWSALGLDDYPTFVQFPMDIGTSMEMIDDESFDFSAFLDRTRLIWANACRYNPPSQPLHQTARRLASLFDEKVMLMQQHSVDDDPDKLLIVYAPLLSALETRQDAEAFLYPVNVNEEVTYLQHVSVPMAFCDVRALLERRLYVERHDIEADISRIWLNARAYLDPSHSICSAADTIESVATHLLSERKKDVDRPQFIVSAQRMQLFDNMRKLQPSDRLMVMKRIGELNPYSITDLADGTSLCCIDSMCLSQFMVVDTMTRRFLVNPTSEATLASTGGLVSHSGEAN